MTVDIAAVDTGLLLGPCPFRSLPSSPEDLLALRQRAGLERAVATGFRSLLYFDPLMGLDEDLKAYESLADWLYFYAVLNPEFPQWQEGVHRAAQESRIAGVRLVPAIHHYGLGATNVRQLVQMAGQLHVPVNLMGRIFDDRIAPRFVEQKAPPLAEVAAFIRANSETTLVLSMFFFGELKALEVNWDELPNAYVDFGCSKPNVASLDELATWFPLERALFGSGAPFYYWGGSRLGLEGSRLDDQQRRGILADNAHKVFTWD
ncbi:MAG: putative TIM-barrel fold metal-dependent hydrolase [Candidatus Latescibacterota bacterium]|jgi:predicted TIM-barrel fold metal-dependent hydrolase